MTTQAPATPRDLDALPADATLNAEDIATILQCSERHVYRMAHDGRLPHPLRIGKIVRWRAGSFRAWLRQSEQEGTVNVS